MAIPRDRVCWYCARGQHDKCGIPKTCACRTCYASLFAPPEGDGFVLDCRPIPLVPLLEEPVCLDLPHEVHPNPHVGGTP